MKRIYTAAIALAMVSGSGTLMAKTFKKYEVRSGKVSYTIRGSGNIMGATQELAGKKRLIFDQYGFRELEEEATVQRTKVMGQVQTEKSHKIVYRNGTKVKIADFGTKTITEMEPPEMSLMIAAANQNLAQMGKDFLKQMGGRMVGTDKVAGYPCEIWKLPAVTQCIYKGVPLRIESNVMGIKRVEEATKAEFDVPVSAKDYKLPDFPASQARMPGADTAGTPSPEDIRKMQQMMAAMGQASSGGGAGKAAMENLMFTQMKESVVASKPALQQLRSCLNGSGTLAEAQGCERAFDRRMKALGLPAEDDTEEIQNWNAAEKRKILGEIDQGLKAIECVRAAKTVAAMQRCQP